jgi:hypothetical protein
VTRVFAVDTATRHGWSWTLELAYSLPAASAYSAQGWRPQLIAAGPNSSFRYPVTLTSGRTFLIERAQRISGSQAAPAPRHAHEVFGVLGERDTNWRLLQLCAVRQQWQVARQWCDYKRGDKGLRAAELQLLILERELVLLRHPQACVARLASSLLDAPRLLTQCSPTSTTKRLAGIRTHVTSLEPRDLLHAASGALD